jgi:hypothetical protein
MIDIENGIKVKLKPREDRSIKYRSLGDPPWVGYLLCVDESSPNTYSGKEEVIWTNGWKQGPPTHVKIQGTRKKYRYGKKNKKHSQYFTYRLENFRYKIINNENKSSNTA